MRSPRNTLKMSRTLNCPLSIIYTAGKKALLKEALKMSTTLNYP